MDLALVEAARSGDGEAFASIARGSADRLFVVAHRILRMSRPQGKMPATMLEAERAIHGSRGLRGSLVKVGYVVLYVNDAEACRRFWIEQVGMVEKRRTEAGDFTIAQVGFADQSFAFELVPLEMMRDNPDQLDLATPSICFRVDDLEATHTALLEQGVQASDVGEHHGTRSFAFSDPEGRWFAVTQ